MIIILFCILGITVIRSNSNNLNTQTFNASGISFQYPQGWTQDTPNATEHEVASLISDKTGSSIFKVIAEDDGGQGLEYWKSIQKDAWNYIPLPGTINSEESVQIAGVNGYRQDYTFNPSYGGGQQADIIFVKNGKYYDLLFSTNSVSGIDSDINSIVDSFQTT